jgi:hypothetical protein
MANFHMMIRPIVNGELTIRQSKGVAMSLSTTYQYPATVMTPVCLSICVSADAGW